MSAAESKMPVRIWITMEDHAASWAGAFRRWHASDLNHGDEYPVYIRADLVEQMAAALRECVELFGDIRSDFSDPRSVCDKGRDIAEAAILRARQAADTEGAK